MARERRRQLAARAVAWLPEELRAHGPDARRVPPAQEQLFRYVCEAPLLRGT